jgi:hypothetical protein
MIIPHHRSRWTHPAPAEHRQRDWRCSLKAHGMLLRRITNQSQRREYKGLMSLARVLRHAMIVRTLRDERKFCSGQPGPSILLVRSSSVPKTLVSAARRGFLGVSPISTNCMSMMSTGRQRDFFCLAGGPARPVYGNAEVSASDAQPGFHPPQVLSWVRLCSPDAATDARLPGRRL